ncbi:UNVERIFIED_CONTAM: hypothetical protein NCL1_56435 [Trichonephila clavipes]
MCSSHFFRRGTTLLSGRVLVHVEQWQRHPTAVARPWVFDTFFPSRPYSALRSRLFTRGTMTTTSYRSRSAVGVRHIFSTEALLFCSVTSWCTRKYDNDILPQPLFGGCSSLFFRRGITILTGRVLVHAER